MASVVTLSAFAANTCVALARFAIAYGGLAFTGVVIWSLPGDVAPTPGHVASIGGIQNRNPDHNSRGRAPTSTSG